MKRLDKSVALLLIIAMVSMTFNINIMSISFADTYVASTESGSEEILVSSTTSSSTTVETTTGASTTVPVIESTNPEDKAIDVSLNEVIKITFDQAVKIGEPEFNYGVQITTDEYEVVKMGIDLISVNEENDHEIILDINEYLEGETTYLVWLDKCIEGVDGGLVYSQYSSPIFSFTTRGEGLFESYLPENNSSVVNSQEFFATTYKTISEEYYNTLSLGLYKKDDEIETLIAEGSGTDYIELEETEKRELTFLINEYLEENQEYTLKIIRTVEEEKSTILEISFSVIEKNLAGCNLSNHKIITRDDGSKEHFLKTVLHDGIVYAPHIDNDLKVCVYTFDLYGSELWNIDLDDIKMSSMNSSNPVVDDDGTVYIQGRVDNSYIIDKTIVYSVTRDGTIKWNTTIDGLCNNNGSPLIYEDELIVDLNKGVASLDLSNNGSLNWSYLDDDLTKTGELFVASDGTIAYVTVNNDESKNKVIGIKDGNVAWEYDDSEIFNYAADVKGEETLYSVDSEGKVIAIDITTGEVDSEDPLNGCSFLKSYEELHDVSSICYSSAGYLYISAYIIIDELEGFCIYCLDDEGNVVSSIFDQSNSYPIVETDDYGYGYYKDNASGLAGTMGIYAVDMYGDIADFIPGYGSSITNYSSFFIEDNVFIGARNGGADVQIVKISREEDEIPARISFLDSNKEYGLSQTEGIPLRTINSNGNDMIVDKIEVVSGDKSIATVSDNNLYGVSEGNVDITAKISGTDIEEIGNTSVVKKPSKITSIEIYPENPTVEYLDTLQFSAKVFDQYGEEMDEEVSWECLINYSNSVVKSGLFTALGVGTFTMDLYADGDSTVKTSTEITVEKKESIFDGFSPFISTLSAGVVERFSPVNQYGEDFSGKSITWSIEDDSIAEIDEDGILTAIKEGSTKISAAIELSDESIIEKSQTINVVEPLYEEVRISEHLMLDDIVEDEDENIYCVENAVEFTSYDKDGNFRWKKDFENEIYFIGPAGNSGVYVLASSDNLKRLVLFSYDGSMIWDKTIELDSYSLRKNPLIDGDKIYMHYRASTCSTILGFDINGEKIFEVGLDDDLTDFIVMPSGEIWALKYLSDNKETTFFRYDEDGNLLDSKAFEEGISFGSKAYSVVDENENWYQFYDDNNTKHRGVCCISKNGIIWKCDFGYKRKIADFAKLVYDGEKIYSADERLSTSRIYALDTSGEIQWKLELSDLGSSGNKIVTVGDIEFRNGNLYVPCFEDESSVSGIIDDKILLIIIDAKTGTVKRYNQFISDDYVDSTEVVDYLSKNGFIEFGKNSIYLNLQGFVTLKGATKSKDYDYVVKFSETTEEERIPTKISITGASSVGIDRKVNLTATLYDQYGGIVKDKVIKWNSENENIAAIDDNGTVTGIAKGDTTISAYIEEYDLSQTYEINVYPLGANNVSPEEISEKIKETVDYYKSSGMPSSDWIAIALSLVGEDITKEPYLLNGESYTDKIEDQVRSKDSLGSLTNYARTTLAVLAGKRDPRNFGGMNLLEGIYEFPNFEQGNNAAGWGLIALSAADVETPQGVKNTEETIIDHLLKNKSGKGWGLSQDSSSDPDMTGMMMYSLAPYRDDEEVKAALDEAVEWLDENQMDNGSFSYSGEGTGVNTESTAQAILALVAIGIDPQSEMFQRSTGNPVSAMLTNMLDDGSFSHFNGRETSGLATNQALQALTALDKFYKTGDGNVFYQMPFEADGSLQLNISSKLSSSEFTEDEEHEISITSTVKNIDDGSEVTFDLIKYKNSELVEIQGVDSITTTVTSGSATGVIKLPSDLKANVYYVRTTSGGVNYYNKIVIKGDLSEESEKDVKVSLKVVGYEGTIIEKDEVKTSLYNLNPYLSEKDGAGTIPGDWEESNFEGVSLAHVLVKALEKEGVSYDIQDYVDSIYINGIDGESAGDYNTGSSWTYRVNGELVNKGIQSIYLSDGDKVEVYFAPFGTETVFASLSANKTRIEVGDEVKVKATGKTNGSSIENVSGADILINGTKSQYVTDSNGEVNIKFNVIGTYEVSIVRYKDGIKDVILTSDLNIIVSKKSSGDSGNSSGGSSGGSSGNNSENDNSNKDNYDVMKKENVNESQVNNSANEISKDFEKEISSLLTKNNLESTKESLEKVSDFYKWSADKIITESGAKALLNENKNVLKSLESIAEKSSEENGKSEVESSLINSGEVLINSAFKLIAKVDESSANHSLKEISDMVSNIGSKLSSEGQNLVLYNFENSLKEYMEEKGTSSIKVNEEEKEVIFNESDILSLSKELEEGRKILGSVAENSDLGVLIPESSRVKLIASGGSEEEMTLHISGSGISNLNLGEEDIIVIKSKVGGIGVSKETLNSPKEQIKCEVKKLDGKNPSIDIKLWVGDVPITKTEKPFIIQIPVDESLINSRLWTVYTEGEDGNYEKLIANYNEKENMLECKVNHLSTFTAIPVEMNLKDVDINSSQGKAVAFLSDTGIITGNEKGEFESERTLKRSEFATLLSRLDELKVISSSDSIDVKPMKFSDITSDKWYYEAVDEAYKKGWMNGKSENLFDPDGNITYEEICKVIKEIMVQEGYDLANCVDSDVSSQWAKESVGFVQRLGFTKDLAAMEISPKNHGTRGNTALLLYNMYKELVFEK